MNNHANSNVYPRRGLMLVLSSPSGAGKTTLAKALLVREENLRMSISFTTRLRRVKEVDGEDYNFVNETKFKKMAEAGEFLEYAQVFGNYYGTPRIPIEKSLASGSDFLFDIDWQGTQQLEGDKTAGKDLVSVFILPPDNDELETRLRTRAQDTDEEVQIRMAKAADEMSHYREYDYIIVNRHVEESVQLLQKILGAERLRANRQSGLHKFVQILRGET